MQELTVDQKNKFREYLVYIGEKFLHFGIILACLYLVFALDLPPHITYVMLKSLLGENAQYLLEEGGSQQNVTCSDTCDHAKKG